MECPVPYPTGISPALRLVHKRLGEVDADVLVNVRSEKLEKDAVAAPEVSDDRVVREMAQRQQPSHSRNRMGIVVVNVSLVVDGTQVFIRPPTGRDRHLAHRGPSDGSHATTSS